MENKNMLFRANFHFSDWVLPEAKDLYIQAYNLMRGRAVELINPRLEKWNAAYNKEITGEDDLEYNGYIADKEQEVLDAVNKILSNSPVKLYANRENADIMGKFIFMGNEITMFMTLEPLTK